MDMQGYEKEVLDDGIIIYRLREGKVESVDAFFMDVAAVFARALETGEPPRLLYDVRALSFPSRHMLQRAEELNDLPAPDTWRVATLTGSQFATSIINLIRSISLRSPDQYKRSRVFTNEVEAIDWLRSSQDNSI